MYVILYTWNPNVPCFDWKRSSFGDKTKDKCVPGIHHHNVISTCSILHQTLQQGIVLHIAEACHITGFHLEFQVKILQFIPHTLQIITSSEDGWTHLDDSTTEKLQSRHQRHHDVTGVPRTWHPPLPTSLLSPG